MDRRAATLVALSLACSPGPDAGPPATGSADSTVATGLPRGTPLTWTAESRDYRATALLHVDRALLNLRYETLGTAPDTASMNARLERLRPLVAEVLRDHALPAFTLTVGTYPELATRLATAAACSDWDPATGTPAAGSAGETVEGWLREPGAIRELAAFFTPFGYRTTVRSAEAVLLCPWRTVAPATLPDECTAPPPDGRMPCGASLLFDLTADPPDARE